MEISTYELITYALFVFAFLHFKKYNDEFLFLPVIFLWTTGISRNTAVKEGVAQWVEVAYTRNIFTPVTDEKALLALGYFALGTLIFVLSYKYYNSKLPIKKEYRDTPDLFNQFIQQKKGFILGLFIFFNLLMTAMRGMMSGPAALGNSYFLLFPMALGGLILLAFLVYRSYSWQDNGVIKLVYLILMANAIFMSYNPTQRFQFLSWMVAMGIVMTQKMDFYKKTWSYVIGGFIVIIFFSIAGVARTHKLSELTYQEIFDEAFERNEKREDQNMLDGFMMVLDVYPYNLDYSYGMEHLEILMRPIPRQLWPNKPLGGYANKLGLNNVNKGTTGISQTIYGTFYGEGGVWGIILFSIFYGWLFVKLFRYTLQYNSDMRWLLRGIIIASFIPILRGGDLPGIVAFIGMSFWPVFLILYQYNKHLKTLPK